MIWLWVKLKGYAAALGIIIVAVGYAFLKGRKAGIEYIETEQAKKSDALQEHYNEISGRGISPGDAYRGLRERASDRKLP